MTGYYTVEVKKIDKVRKEEITKQIYEVNIDFIKFWLNFLENEFD